MKYTNEENVARVAEQLLGPRVATLAQSNAFGENGLGEAGIQRNATVLAMTPTHLFKLSREAMHSATGKQRGAELPPDAATS